jgi:hypothetical protein
MELGSWNWLEVAKLVSGGLTSIVLAGIGIYIHRITKQFEHAQWRSQKLIEKRIAVYDELMPEINDVLCYFTYVGCWRDLDPPTVVSLKRIIDKKMHLAFPLFSREFHDTCLKFQSLCFETYNGWGQDARLRTHFQRRKEARAKDWRSDWDSCFSDSNSLSDVQEIRAAYNCLVEAFACDIGVDSIIIPPSTRAPKHIK